MKALAGGGVAIAFLLCVPVAISQTLQATPPKPHLANVHSRGVQVLMPGQASASDGVVAPPSIAPPAPPKPVFVVVPVTRPVVKSCDLPFSPADLTLGEKGFDRSLSGALRGGATVVVNVGQPYDQGAEPPSSLTPWLSAAKSGGGAITVSPYCAGGRGIVRDWVEDVVGRLSGRMYRPARNYDVVLYADAARRKVTQVRFKPKSSVVAVN